MWTSKDVYATIKGFSVRVKDERQNDRNHLVEVTFETPLTYDLADEILPAMARDLFDKNKNPKPEMTSSVFTVDVKKQILTVRLVPGEDLGHLRILAVAIRDIEAEKDAAKTWVLKFKANWTLGSDDKEAVLFIRQLRQGVYLSMEQMQGDLLADTETTDKERGTDEVSQARARRGRKARTETPEGEAKTQAEDAAARQDEQPGEPTPPATH